MRSTKLILVEGIPGSGKSTTGQFLTQRFAESGMDVRWWYEEMKGHPLYIFDDEASLEAVVRDLVAGQFENVVEQTLDRWRQLAEWLREFDGLVILDSSFLGHLTWTLFGFDAPSGALEDYVAKVTEIIRPANPVLMYVRHDNVRATMENVCAVRGEQWANRTIRNAAGCPYGVRVGLVGFDGLVSYWSEYREISDRLVHDTNLPTLIVDTSDGDWARSYDLISGFLGLTSVKPNPNRDEDLGAFVGTYSFGDGETRKSCEISIENGDLIAHHVPRLWPWNRLIRTSGDIFAAASFPIEIVFQRDEQGKVRGARITGPDMLDGRVDWEIRRTEFPLPGGEGKARSARTSCRPSALPTGPAALARLAPSHLG